MPSSEAGYSTLSFSKQPSRRPASRSKPDDRSRLRTTTQKGRSQVELNDDLILGPSFNTCYVDHYTTKQGVKSPTRILRGSVPKTTSLIDMDDHQTGGDVYHSTTREAHFNHGKMREKVVYPYRNASQVELGRDKLDYNSSSQFTHNLSADKYQYEKPARNPAGQFRTRSNVNLGHSDHTPYIKGLPLMAMSMPELDPSKLRGRTPGGSRPGTGMSGASSVRVGSKARLGGSADVKVMSPLMAAAHRQTLEEQGIAELAAERNERLAAERRAAEAAYVAALGGVGSVGVDEAAAGPSREGGEGEERDEEEGFEEDGVEGEEEKEEEGEEGDGEGYYEYTDYHNVDPLPPSTIPPHKATHLGTPDRVTWSRGSVNKMASQFSLGWTAEPPLYISTEHAAFPKQSVRRYEPLEHQRTKSQVKIRYQRRQPQDYVSVTHEHFPDLSAAVKDEVEAGLGTRIMGDKRQQHTVNVQRGELDGQYSRGNKYAEDFRDVDTSTHSPTLARKGKNGKTLSQVELQKQTEDDPWEADPKGMYDTTANRMHDAKPLSPLWRQQKDFKFRSNVNIKHPIRNKHNQMKYYVQQEQRLMAAQAAADANKSPS